MEGMQKINDDFYVDKSKQLGKGNFGTVYKGYHLSENRIIAVKFMEKKMLDRNPQYERQIKVMQDLAKIKHPNIMGYYGYEINKDGLYCFIEFCSGGSLKGLASTKISQLKVITLFRQLLDAMAYISSLNMVHRDLKPDNILLDEHRELKIADFGLARNLDVMMTKGACTPLYAAPQVINLEIYNEKCDVWSAGLILYEMLVGREMFASVKTKSQLVQELNKFSTGRKMGYSQSLHPKWQKITSMMLTFDKDKRPSFGQLLIEFDKLRVDIQEDLNKKYGYDAQEIDDGVRITRTVSPYQSIPVKYGKVDMFKKLKQEQSYTNLNNLRKYLVFYRMKSEFFTKLIREFTANLYGNLKNVYKYMLMFLSTSTYVSRLEQNVVQIKSRKISTSDGPLTESDFEAVHRQEFLALVDGCCKNNQISIAKYKGIIQKQISSKILTSYMKREEEKKVIEATSNILKLIEEVNEGHFRTEDDYMNLYKKIMNMEQVYVQSKELEKFSENDVKTYMYIRIMGNMDEVFPSMNYINDDYIRMKKQEFQSMIKKEAIEFIKFINDK